MEFQREELNEILNIFQQESTEIITSMDDKLLSLEKNGQNKNIAMQLFRDAHSLKGSARMLGFNDIQNLAHKIEDIISLVKEDKLNITTKITDTISECLDFMQTLVQKTVENKEEYKSENLPLYIQKLEEIEQNDQIQKVYVDVNSEIDPVKKEFLLNFEKIENIIIDILYYASYARANKDSNKIEDLKEKLKEFIEISDNIEQENFQNIKNALDETINSVYNYISSDNKAFSFLEINNCITNLIDTIYAFKKVENIQEKDYYEIVENRLNNVVVEKPKENSVLIKEIQEKLPLLELNCTFFDTILESINDAISKEKNYNAKEIYLDLKEIIQSFKEKDIAMTQGLAYDLQQIVNSIETSDPKIIEEAKIKINIIKTMVKYQNNEIKKRRPNQRRAEENQKEILKTITNTEIKTLRVDSSKLDNLVGQIGELIVSKIKTNEQLSLAKKINNDLMDWQKNFSKMNYYIKYFDKKYLSTSLENPEQIQKKLIAHNKQLSSLVEQHNEKINYFIKEISDLFKQLQESENKLTTTTSEIEEMVKNMRILPLSTIFQLFPRMVHNIARDKNKKIDLIIEGADITADKTIIEELKIPLMHIIRNSIDHGIEDTETRKAMGKNPVGKIEINATYKDNKIVVDVKDDGRGLDIEKIKNKALEKKLLTKEELEAISDEEITNLIFYPGFSTEDFVTELSGRGLGLDIVSNKISHLQGRIDVFSTLNKGTMVRIILPATVATRKVFIIEEDKQLFAIDTSVIKTIVRINSDEIFEKDNHSYYIYNNNAITIYSLSQILNFNPQQEFVNKYTLMILETDNISFGIIVQKLISDQEIVHKKLAPPLYKVKHISGITTLANGETCLILSVSDIISTVTSKKINTTVIADSKINQIQDKSKYKILIVDDSHTTRILQKNILTNDGYNVASATNPIHAFEKLKLNQYDLIISDIQMPEMDGIEFITKLRQQESYSKTPIFIVSSEPREKYEEKIQSLHILKYIEKNSYKQNELLKYIREVLNY